MVPVEIVVELFDRSDLVLDFLSFLHHLLFLVLHSRIHFVELLLFLIEILVLGVHDFFVVVQECSHFLQLLIFQDLEPAEVCLDLVWRRDRRHFGDAGLQELVLRFHDALVVSEKLLQLQD